MLTALNLCLPLPKGSTPHVFFGVFFVLVFGVFFPTGFAFGRPRVPPSRMVSSAVSLYIPAEPMYLKGSTPFRLSLILTAADEIPSRWAISNTVIPSIHLSISAKSIENQGKIDKMLQHCYFFLHICIGNSQKIFKFLSRTLTIHSGYCNLLICYNTVTNKKRLPEAPAAEGELYGNEKRTRNQNCGTGC